jgi:hypothetical protein
MLSVLVLTLTGCQAAPASHAPTATSPTAMGVAELRADALACVERGDLDGALRAAREAVSRAPQDAPALYLLGVVLTRLDQLEAATLVFQQVLEHGPRTAEGEAARRWLVEAGALPAMAEAPARPADDTTLPVGQVEGRTEWPRAPEQGLPKLQILLVGSDGEVRGRRYATRVQLNEAYAIANVPAGQYQLMAQVGQTRLWEQAITVEEGKTAQVHLTPATAVAAADALTRVP